MMFGLSLTQSGPCSGLRPLSWAWERSSRSPSRWVRFYQPDSHEVKRSPERRREVHQATGMILIQLDTTATDAFAALRAYAFASDRTVNEIAHDVLTGVIDFRQLPAQ